SIGNDELFYSSGASTGVIGHFETQVMQGIMDFAVIGKTEFFMDLRRDTAKILESQYSFCVALLTYKNPSNSQKASQSHCTALAF
ncbi:MAG: hypothetical protein J7J32_02505, partial [Candidatus Atribacteria bacterium]|nr:hypothetical protein [Candidatus Atribacteria bacterium]MCD6349585.1 hypothetical protein [Candidatus Atribacteria bacterium]